jgi:hypothetical protein
MRAFAFFMLTGGLLATAAAPVFAAQIVETFTISVSVDADQHFMNSPFDLFDPFARDLNGRRRVGDRVAHLGFWRGRRGNALACAGENGREPDFHLRR